MRKSFSSLLASTAASAVLLGAAGLAQAQTGSSSATPRLNPTPSTTTHDTSTTGLGRGGRMDGTIGNGADRRSSTADTAIDRNMGNARSNAPNSSGSDMTRSGGVNRPSNGGSAGVGSSGTMAPSGSTGSGSSR